MVFAPVRSGSEAAGSKSAAMFAAAQSLRAHAGSIDGEKAQLSGQLQAMLDRDFDGPAPQAGIMLARHLAEKISSTTQNMLNISQVVEIFAEQMQRAELLESIATAAINAAPAPAVVQKIVSGIKMLGYGVDLACAAAIDAACFGAQHLPHRFRDFARTTPDFPEPLAIDDIHTIQACRAPDALLTEIDAHPDLRLLENSESHWAAMVGKHPDDTDNIVVFVPGVHSADPESYSDQIDRARTHAAQMSGAGVIYSYDAPDSLVTGTSSQAARVAGPQLRDFLDDIDARYPDHHVTVVGHSFGSVVVGKASADESAPLRADDVVIVGSPGVGHDNAGQMHLRGDHPHVHAARRALDPISALAYPSMGLFGPNPAAPDFGAQRWPGDGMLGHSEFFTDPAYLEEFSQLAQRRGLTGAPLE